MNFNFYKDKELRQPAQTLHPKLGIKLINSKNFPGDFAAPGKEQNIL